MTEWFYRTFTFFLIRKQRSFVNIICYELQGENTWEMVSGEDAMQIRVDELMKKLDCEAQDIMVFDKTTEL